VDRAGGRVQLDAWLEALRDFARVTRFTDFFTAHRRTYRALERQVITELANTDITGAFERYYGARPRSYHVVLSPLLHPGGFGARVKSPAGLEIYSILGPLRGLDGGLADFGAGATLRRLLWHEFGHSFANPLVDRHAGRVRRAGALYAPVSAEMRRQAYGNWMVTVREHVVRAIVVRLVTLHAGEREGRRVLDEELSSGFAYIGALCRRLEEYDRNRDRYPTFDVFFPRLLRVFDKAAAQYTSLVENAGHRVLIRAAPAAVRLGLFSRLRAGRFRLEKETGGEMVFCSEQEPRRVVAFRFDLCPSGLLVTPSSRARELRTLLVDLKLASERPGL
jgi:hypothetical protein